MRQRKFKSYIINPRFQLKMIIVFLIPLVGVSLANYVAMKLFFSNFMAQGLSAGFPIDHVFFEFLEKQREALSRFLGFSFTFALLIFFIVGFYFSHKIAGPLYRLRKSFEKMREQKRLESVTFRDGDYFQDVKDEFNSLVKDLES